jgi:FdhE protein
MSKEMRAGGHTGSPMAVMDEILPEHEGRMIHGLPHTDIGSSLRRYFQERARFKAALPSLADLPIARPEPFRFAQGVPLLDPAGLLRLTDSWELAAERLLSAMQDEFPRIRQDIRLLRAAMRTGGLDPIHCMALVLNADDKEIDKTASNQGMDPQAARCILGQFLRACVEKRVEALKPLIADLPWSMGYCPICGCLAELSFFRGVEDEKWLMCALCGHQWRFERARCSFCENIDENQMEYISIEGGEYEQLELCHVCGRYLVCIDTTGRPGDHDVETDIVGLTRLDMIARGMGFLPVATCAWSGPSGAGATEAHTSSISRNWIAGLQ